MNALIEDYLRSTGLRYFRGHHDDEYFFLVDFLYTAGAHHGRLHVHIEACRDEPGAVQVSITPDRFYPSECRDQLSALAVRWNAGHTGSEVMVAGHTGSEVMVAGHTGSEVMVAGHTGSEVMVAGHTGSEVMVAGHTGSVALVHDSSDPALVGMIVQTRQQPGDAEALASLVDDTVAAGIELFGWARQAGVAAPSRELRHAG